MTTSTPSIGRSECAFVEQRLYCRGNRQKDKGGEPLCSLDLSPRIYKYIFTHAGPEYFRPIHVSQTELL
jgi:hypothetical protein